MDYKKKYELGSIVTATRKFNIETITGEFGGFHLLDKSNPKSIVGVVHTPNGSYDVEPNSIESVISENERIRKSLLSHFSRYQEDTIFLNDITMGQIVAWLEKQGEKNIPEDINEAALQYVDTCAVDGEITHDNITEPYWNNHSMMNAYKAGWLEKQGEQKPTDKVEPKFKVGDVMRTPQEAADGFTDGMPVVVYIDDEYYHCTNALIAIKNQDDYEYPPMNRRQKTAWSEDDNELIDSVIELIDSGALDRSEKDYFIENLKSLKDRYTWKPSDEQMKQLGWVAKQNKDNMIGKELMSLYQDLKKLKDE